LSIIFTHLLPKNKAFYTFFNQIMDSLDRANYWELTHTRIAITPNQSGTVELNKLPYYGDYQVLADRSLGHGLGPIVIMLTLGYSLNQAPIKRFLQFTRHYLIARQLNDDAHDWESDLLKGRLSPVVTMILYKYRQRHPNQARLVINDTNIQKLKVLFWNEVVEEFTRLLTYHLDAAEKNLKAIKIIDFPEPFYKMLLPHRKSAEKALSESEKAKQFLAVYQ
jgi:hypothetical protein